MPGRKEVKGAAAALTLASSITNISTSCQASGSVTGWPTGASYPFVITIDRGLATEERILCSSLTGSGPATISFTTRGYDGTAAASHNSGVAIEHTLDADTIDSLFAHNFDVTRDDHTQYIRTNGARAFTALTAIAGTPVAIGTAISAGIALTLARSDHVHNIGTGAINASGMFAAGVVNNAAIGALAVDSGKLANLAVTSGKLADNAVVANKIDAAALTSGLALSGGQVQVLLDASAQLAYGAFGALKLNASFRPIIACTAATRPGSPSAGQGIFETDTMRIYFWDGSSWMFLMSLVMNENPGYPRQASVTGGPTSGTTELTLATVNVPALPYPSLLTSQGFWSSWNSVAGDTFDFRLKVNGVEKAKVTNRHQGGVNERRHYNAGPSTAVAIAANTTATVIATIQRQGGTGTLTEETPGVLTTLSVAN